MLKRMLVRMIFLTTNDDYNSEELRSPISTDDDGDGNGRQVSPHSILAV